jgi:hypothetical protein
MYFSVIWQLCLFFIPGSFVILLMSLSFFLCLSFPLCFNRFVRLYLNTAANRQSTINLARIALFGQ